MLTKLNSPVSVVAIYDHRQGEFSPRKLLWSGRVFELTKLGLHHTYRQGRTLYHVFSATSKEVFFRLELNSETLGWTLREISDGLPN